MPDLFTPFKLKDITLRNRIAMSPMTMYRSVDGKMTDFHVMLMGSRAAGGFGLVFPEQIAITPDGRTSTSCAGIYDDAQKEGLCRVAAIVKDMGAVPAIQLGHTGRRGSENKPWEGKIQLAPDHPEGWQVRGPSAIPYGGRYTHPVHALGIDEIHELHRAYAEAARRALDCGFEWLEMHFAHGYLGASFFSPLANQRSDKYGGSRENRLRFHREALDAVRSVWPERLPLTLRLGSDDFHEQGIQFDDAVWAIAALKEHGLDFADISLGLNTEAMRGVPFDEVGFMAERAGRVRREAGIPVGVSWNMGVPEAANRVIEQEVVDVVFLGRPALANPHWPVWAARELGHGDPLDLIPEDWSWWLRRRPKPEAALGWPPKGTNSAGEPAAGATDDATDAPKAKAGRKGGSRKAGDGAAPKAKDKAKGDAKAAPTPRTGTKQAQLIEMLRAPEGASIDEIVAATGWRPHTIRGAIAGALKKKLGLDVTSEKVDARGRVYRIEG